jgi:pimeloyl-ACP methyl ester carboxylesterase
MSTFVLIHGSWHGAWCWEKLTPLLRQTGHQVQAIDLPGRGADRTPPSDLSLATYARRICAELDAATEPVVLVGHSMGGVPITQAAEYRPEKIQTLVYLAAFLPRNGESLVALAQQDTQSQLLPNLTFREDRGDHLVNTQATREVLYADCSDDDAARASQRLVPEPLAPVVTPVQTTPERWGRLPRVYITTLRDRAVGPLLQQQMYTASPCQHVLEVDTGHSPFLAAPDTLAQHLLAIAAQVAPSARPATPRPARG